MFAFSIIESFTIKHFVNEIMNIMYFSIDIKI